MARTRVTTKTRAVPGATPGASVGLPPGPTAMVTPADHPELARLAWNRDLALPIPARDAFGLYEANWRHIDAAALTNAERRLVQDLADQYGGGHLLVTK